MEVEYEKIAKYGWLQELVSPSKFAHWMNRNNVYQIHKGIEFANYCRAGLKRKWFESDEKLNKRKESEWIQALEYKLDQLYYDDLNDKKTGNRCPDPRPRVMTKNGS